jgi:hypothetical protein
MTEFPTIFKSAKFKFIIIPPNDTKKNKSLQNIPKEIYPLKCVLQKKLGHIKIKQSLLWKTNLHFNLIFFPQKEEKNRKK